MGCMQTQQGQTKNLYQRYAEAGLVMPQFDETENDFERQLFFAINLLRHKPKNFIPSVQRAYSQCAELKTSKSQKDIIAALRACETLPLCQFNDDANKAVRENNKAIVEKNESADTLKAKPSAGNIAKYQEIAGADKAAKCAEASQYHYTGSEAEEMVVMLLAQFFDKQNAAKTQPTKSPSQKETEQQKKDADAAAAKAEGEKKEGEKKEGEQDDAAGAEKTDAAAAEAADKPVTDGKPPEADVTTSPLLDADATQIGISNKAHTAALNSIQFLWIMKKSNAMI